MLACRLCLIHIIVSAEKTSNNIVFVTALKLCTIREVEQHYLYVNVYVYFKFPAYYVITTEWSHGLRQERRLQVSTYVWYFDIYLKILHFDKGYHNHNDL